MKTLAFLGLIGLLLAGCGKSNVMKAQKRQKTPSHLTMTQSEKLDMNYDAKVNQKIIQTNLKNKEANQKIAEKNRKKQVEQLTELNNNSSKVKRRKNNHEAFNFY